MLKAWAKPFLLAAAPFCLALGLVLPLVTFEKLYFFSDSPSLVAIIAALWTSGDRILAALVFLLSVACPVVKMIGLAAEAVDSGRADGKGVVHRLLPLLSRWSMMDVMLVAVVIVAAKTSGLASAFTQPGLWVYAASAIAAGLLQGLIAKS